jgi:hypothetical protein
MLNPIYYGDQMRTHKEFEELENAVDIIIHTKVPTKWLLVDRETGQVYQGSSNGHWDRLDPYIKEK